MPEETGAAQPQGGEGAQAQGATSPAQGAAPQPAHGASGTGDVTVESLTAKLALLEKDNLSYRERERKREEAEKAKTEAEMSEAEKLQARVTELESELAERAKREQEQSLRLASMTAAQKLGFKNPEVAYRWLLSEPVQFDGAGNPTNVESLLTAFAKSDPSLLSHTDFGGGPRGTSAAQTNDMNALIRRAAGR